MHGDPTFDDHDDGDELTSVYWKPEDHAPPEARMSPYPAVRSYEVSDRFAIPTPLAFAPSPTLFAPARHPRASRIAETVAVRRVPGTLLGLGFAGLCVLVGISIGGVIVLTGGASSSAHATGAPASIMMKPIAAAPVISPVAVAAAQPALVTVRVESNPPGATAMLVVDGKATLLGVTPVDAALDGSRTYDVVFVLDHHDKQAVHLDPATQKQISATLVATVEEPAPVPAPVVARHHRVTSHSRTVVVAAPVAAASGKLVVSSKPPTSIVIDGKPTGLTTPQASLAMPAGHHEITLTNAAEGISLTTAVEITADHPTRLIQDFTR